MWGENTSKYANWLLLLFSVRTPLTDHFGPPCWLQKVPILHWSGLWPSNAFHRFSFTRSLYRIQLWGHWHHFNGFAISKNPLLYFWKTTVFWALEMFLSPRPIWTFIAEKEVCQILNYTANCDVGLIFFFWNGGGGVKYAEICQLNFFWSGDLTDHFGRFLAGKGANRAYEGFRKIKNGQK